MAENPEASRQGLQRPWRMAVKPGRSELVRCAFELLVLAVKEERPRLARRSAELAERIRSEHRNRCQAELAEHHARQHHQHLTGGQPDVPYVLGRMEL
jgi:hypothetical protein